MERTAHRLAALVLLSLLLHAALLQLAPRLWSVRKPSAPRNSPLN